MSKLNRADDLFTDDASSQRRLDSLERGVFAIGGVGPPVTTLPATATDGTILRLLHSDSGGVVWTFRYRAASASTYKWECVGGPPAYAEINTAQVTTSASYTDLATTGPEVIVAREGEYNITWGAARIVNTTGGNIGVHIGVRRGASTAPTDADSLGEIFIQPGIPVSGLARSRNFLAEAGGSVRLQYKHVTGAASIEKRWISVIPVRVK